MNYVQKEESQAFRFLENECLRFFFASDFGYSRYVTVGDAKIRLLSIWTLDLQGLRRRGRGVEQLHISASTWSVEKLDAKMSDQWNFGTKSLGLFTLIPLTALYRKKEQESAGHILRTLGDE